MKPLDPRVLPHLRPAATSLVAVVVGSTLGGILALASAFAVTWLVVGLVQDGAWQPAAIALAVVGVLRGLVTWATEYAATRAAGQVSTALRERVVLARLSERFDDPGALGSLGLLATRGVSAVEPYVTKYLPALVVSVVLPVLTVLAIASQDWLSGLIVVLTLPLIPVFAVLIGLATQAKADKQWRLLSVLSGHFLDVVRGLPTLVAFRRAKAQSRTIREVTERYRAATLDTLKVAFMSSAALELIATISVALVAVTVGLRLQAGHLELGTALVVLLMAPEAYWPLRRVGAEFHSAAEGTATFEEISALLDGDLEAQPKDNVAVTSAPFAGDLRVTDLTVSYADRVVVDDLSVEIPRRGLTAISGPSGCGKSTLLGAILGEIPRRAGFIGFDAGQSPDSAPRDIDDALDTWRAQVATVGQRPWLVAGTIADNVRMGRPEASDEQVRAALRAVSLDLELDRQVGEDGHLLSAGQKARLAMARVVASEREWVLLDEPTAHLDAETERLLLETLTDLARHRAVVVVAHRDAVLAAADQIISLPAAHPDANTTLELDEVVELADPVAVEEPAGGSPQAPEAPSVRIKRGHPWLGSALATLAAAFGVALTATAGWLIVRASEQPPVLFLMVAIVGVRMFGLGRPALRYAERLVTHDDALRLLARRRAEVYDRLVPLVPARLGRHRGDLLTSLVDDVDSFVDQELRVRLPAKAWIGVCLLSVLVAGWLSPGAGVVAALVTIAGGAAVWLVARLAAARHEQQAVAARADISREVVATLSDARQLILWQAQARAISRIRDASQRSARHLSASGSGLALGHGLAITIGSLGVLAMVQATSEAMQSGALSAPLTAMLLLLPLAVVDVISPLADAGSLSVRTAAARARVEALAAQPPAVTDPPQTTTLPADAAAVRAEQITVGWVDHEPVLHDLSFDLGTTARLGVVGPSGCGKSTLAALLMRFLLPTAGQVTLDSHSYQQLTGDQVRELVGLVDDDPYLFASSIAENIRLARPSASDAEVEMALRAAHLGEWLDHCAAGLATRIGEGGAQVSGGERARLGVARAVLANPRVLVLDEPTAHLDTATARQVSAELLAAGSGRNIVWITHTEIGLDQMDLVLQIGSDGRAIETDRLIGSRR